MTPLETKIAAMIAPVLEAQSVQLVDLSLKGGVLQIMAEDPQSRNLGVDQCAVISREVSAILDVEDPIRGAYRLEVSSPGIDRPLVRLSDYTDFAGLEAKVELSVPLDGQKKFRGYLKGIEDESGKVLIDTDQGAFALDFDHIDKARLVMTDELLKKTATNKNKSI